MLIQKEREHAKREEDQVTWQKAGIQVIETVKGHFKKLKCLALNFKLYFCKINHSFTSFQWMFLNTQVPERMGYVCVSLCDVAGVGVMGKGLKSISDPPTLLDKNSA